MPQSKGIVATLISVAFVGVAVVVASQELGYLPNLSLSQLAHFAGIQETSSTDLNAAPIANTKAVISVPINIPVMTIAVYPEDPARPGYTDANIYGGSVRITDIEARNVTAGPQSATRLNEMSKYKGAGTASLNFNIVKSFKFIYKTNITATNSTDLNNEFPGYFYNPPEANGKVTGSVDARYLLTTLLRRREGKDICSYVDSGAVRYVWLQTWHKNPTVGPWAGIEIGPIESNMSMGRISQAFWNRTGYGDISNSYRHNDLPVCNKTYVVIGGIDGPYHILGHQIESVFSWADGGSGLWRNFTHPIDHQNVSREYSVSAATSILDVSAGDPDVVDGGQGSSSISPGNWGHARVTFVGVSNNIASAHVSIPSPISTGPYPVNYYSGAVTDTDPVYKIGLVGGPPLTTATKTWWIADATGRRYDLKIVVWQNAGNLGFKFHKPSADASIVYGCGDIHYPPNGESHYDYTNPRIVTTDCNNWSPFATPASTQQYSCSTTGCSDIGFYTYWYQHVPGYQNNLPFRNSTLLNWWEFVGDFDAAAAAHGQNLAVPPLLKVELANPYDARVLNTPRNMDYGSPDYTTLARYTFRTYSDSVVLSSIKIPFLKDSARWIQIASASFLLVINS